MSSGSGLGGRVGRLPAGSRAAALDDVARRPAAPWVVLAVLLLGAGAFLYHEGHGQIPWYDEWDFLLNRGGHSLATFLKPHNEHLSLLPIAVYKLLLATAGLDHYGPYRLTAIALHLLCMLLLFVYARRRLGAWMAFAPVLLMLFLGPAWQVIVWPFQIAWVASLAAGLGALLMLDRRDRLGDAVASGLLVVSLSSSGLGVAITAGVLVEVLWSRDRWRRLWVVAVPLALYALWYVSYSESHFSRHSLPQAPSFAADGAAASLSALAGLAGPPLPETGAALDWGRPLLVLAVVALVWRIVRLGRLTPRLAMLLAGGLAFWLLTAVSRAGFAYAPPYSSRYIYVGALFAVLIAVEVARGVSLARPAVGLLVAVLAISLVSNVGALRDASRSLTDRSTIRAARLGAVEMTRRIVDPAFATAPYITAGRYLAVAGAHGSPALSPDRIAVAPEPARESADQVLVAIHKVAPRPGGRPGGKRPTVEGRLAGSLAAAGSCITLIPAGYQSPLLKPALDLLVPGSGLVLRAERGAPVELFLRRFGASYPTQPLGRLAGGATTTLAISPDLGTQPWHLHLVPAGRVTACGRAGGG
jgi:hypothetical protein